MKETLSNSSETHPSNTENLWDMQDAPAFDPEAAQKNIEAARNADFNPEDYKDPNKLQNQLEQLNINKAILDNPAFQNILDNVAFRIGYNQNISSDGLQQDYTGETFLRIDCEDRYNNREQVQNSMFRFSSDGNGSLILKSAQAKRERRPSSFLKAPEGYRYVRDDGKIDCFDYDDITEATVFSIDPKTSNLIVNTDEVYENDLVPQVPFSRSSVSKGYCFTTRSESRRVFDADGIEQHRQDVVYNPDRSNITSLPDILGKSEKLNPAIMLTDSQVNVRFAKEHGVEYRTYYNRIDDKTMSITHFEKGQKIEIPNATINNEHGTERLIPQSRVIEEATQDALSASSNK